MSGASLIEADVRSRFIQHMRSLPGAVAVIATAANGQRTGLAATAWTSLCADPPMLLVCINKSASAHDLISRSGAFTINLLRTEDCETVAIFSKQRGLEGDQRFLVGDWDEGDAGQPLFKHAIAAFECRLVTSHDHGSHSIVIGEVSDVRGSRDGNALLYLDGRFGSCVDAP